LPCLVRCERREGRKVIKQSKIKEKEEGISIVDKGSHNTQKEIAKGERM
jgi:hypothetical protein